MAIVYIDVTPPTYTQKTDAAWQHSIHLKSFQFIALRPIVKSLCMPMLLLGTGRLAAAAEALETTRYRGGQTVCSPHGREVRIRLQATGYSQGLWPRA